MCACEVLIARHGQTDWNRDMRWQGGSDIPLNAYGVSQAENLGNSLLKSGISRIYSSDLMRARKTASIVAAILNLPEVIVEERFRERYLGEFEGWHTGEVAKYAGMPEEQAHRLETDELLIDGFPGVERWSDFTERIWAGLNQIGSKNADGRFLLVAHGGVMRAVTTVADGSGNPKLVFENTEILGLSFEDGSWKLL